MLLPGGGKLLETFVTDLGLVKLLGVARELVKDDVAIPLFGNALPRLFQGFGHCEREKYECCTGEVDLSMSILQYVDAHM